MAKPQSEEGPAETRPRFAAGFPADPELDALVRAFEAGDYKRVRDEAPKLAAKSEDAEVKRAAGVLVARTKADPTAVWLLVLAAALLVGLSTYWIVKAHPHGPPAPPPVAPTVEYPK
jgi:hypothetical protein